ncbi:MFS transporter [Verticiella sediminum]|uniref:MFS transporter n=1 Tax=Verticiella sediminum TaxID=1247510 RepID=A0A556AMY5_9BURK|nr:MFS transporter [Verticiella sediminum]
MQMLDATVVATALPVMAEAFGVTPVRMNVTITSYLLAVATFVPLSGWAADRFGAKQVFAAAMLLFILSSIGCAASASLPQLVAARVAQGLAGAMMVPVGRVILLRSVPKSELVRAMSFLSIPALLGPVVGPPLGGAIVTYVNWHWIFLINVPIGLIGLVLVLRHVPHIELVMPRPPLDWLGFLLTSAALVAIIYSFEAIGHSTLSGMMVLGIFAFGLLCAALYVWHARRTAYPIVDLGLLRVPTFAIASLGGNLCRFPIGAMPFLLVLLLQVGFGLSPLAAGMITFVGAVGALMMKIVAVPVIRRFGFRRVLVTNAIATGVFTAACALFTETTPYWLMLAVLLLGGFFRSLQLTAVNTLTYADVGPESMSRASGLAAMAQQVGISLGVGIAAVTVNLSMAARGGTQLGVGDVHIGFIVIGVLVTLSAFSFWRLNPSAGEEMAGRGRSG